MQVGDTLGPALLLPSWVNSALAFFLILGFPLTLFFAWAFELTPDGLKKEKEVDRSESTPAVNSRKLDFTIIGVLLLALGYFAFDKFVLDTSRDAELVQDTTEAVTEQVTKAGKSVTAGKSIAVLAFANMSNDPDQEYFSDGISEELLNVLAQFPGLRVAARTSSFQFKGQNRDISDVARQLGVNHVLDGSVRKAGNRLRITAQLIDASSGFQLWSKTYDRELDDIFAIQDEISASIGAALKIELQLNSGDGPKSLPFIPAAASAQAYEYYLKGRQLINQRGRSAIEEGITALEHSLELDEHYAPSHAQLAIAITLLKDGGGGGSYGDLSMKEVLERAVPHLDRAFELDPNLAEAFGARALLATFQLDYPSTFENGKKALALNPSYVDVINWLYVAFLNTGQWVQASETMEQMMRVDPLSIVGRSNYAWLLARTGRFDEAEQVADTLEKLNSRTGYSVRALISANYLGKLTESSKWYLKAHGLDPDNGFIRHRIANNFAAVNEFDEARRVDPNSRWWVNAVQQRWNKATAQAQQRLDNNSGASSARLDLANVLHMSGQLAAAQSIYEELLVTTGGYIIINAGNSSNMPTARMAYGRLAAGDVSGTESILELVKQDFQRRKQAGIYDFFMLRGAAMVAAMEGDRERMLASLSAAIDAGLRDDFIFREPAMAAYVEDPGFEALAIKLDKILEEEHRKTLQLICFNNPIPATWQPLPETCEGVQEIP